MSKQKENISFLQLFFNRLEKKFATKKSKNPFDKSQIKQLHILALYLFVIVTGIFFMVFSFISFFLIKELWAGVYQVITTILFLYFLWQVKVQKNYHQTALYATLTLAIGAFVYIGLVHEKYLSFIWTSFVPFFFIFLLGSKHAIKFVLFFDIAISLFALYGVFYWKGNWDLINYLHYIMFLYGVTFFYFLFEYIISKQEQRLIWLSETDPLTTMYNRRKIENILEYYYLIAKEEKSFISIALLDVDDFKNINDQLGHTVGDQVLSELAFILKNNLPQNCYVGRWGGEEFLFVFPNKDTKLAKKIIQGLNTLITNHSFYLIDKVQCSIGICGTADPPNLEKMIIATDRALYTAKERGKNQIVISRCKSYRLKDN